MLQRSITIRARYVLRNTCDPSRYVHVTYCTTLAIHQDMCTLRTAQHLRSIKICAHYVLRNTRSQNHRCINTHEVCTLESVIWPPAIWLMPAWFKVSIQQTGMCKWNTAFECQPTVLFVMLFKTEIHDIFASKFFFFDIMTELAPLNA